MKGKVIHSSLRQLKRIGVESELPVRTEPTAGVLVELIRNGTGAGSSAGVSALISTYLPKLDDFLSGETIPVSDSADSQTIDLLLRCKLEETAKACLELAEDLKQHAARLKAASKEQNLLHGFTLDSGSLPDREAAYTPRVPRQATPARPACATTAGIGVDDLD